MQKVIILSGECGDDETLIALIHLLLPQCRVEVVSKGTRAVEIFAGESGLARERKAHPFPDLTDGGD
jgi:hypothetical protein